MQKTYTPDFLSGKQKKNYGELAMYLVEYAHEAIIDRETFDNVQEQKKKLNKNIFSGFLKYLSSCPNT